MRAWQGCESEQDQALAGMFPHRDRLLHFRHSVCQVVRDFFGMPLFSGVVSSLRRGGCPIAGEHVIDASRIARKVQGTPLQRLVRTETGTIAQETLFPSILTISKYHEKITFLLSRDTGGYQRQRAAFSMQKIPPAYKQTGFFQNRYFFKKYTMTPARKITAPHTRKNQATASTIARKAMMPAI